MHIWKKLWTCIWTSKICAKDHWLKLKQPASDRVKFRRGTSNHSGTKPSWRKRTEILEKWYWQYIGDEQHKSGPNRLSGTHTACSQRRQRTPILGGLLQLDRNQYPRLLCHTVQGWIHPRHCAATTFLTLDGTSRPWQVEVANEDRDKTVLWSPHEPLRFTRISFGIKTHPGRFIVRWTS